MYNFEIWLVALTWQCGQSCYVCFFLFVLLLVLHHHLLRLVTFLNVYIANSLGLFTYRFVFSVYFVEEINGKEPKRKVPRFGCRTNTPGNALSLNLLTVCVAPNLNNSPGSLARSFLCVSLFLYVACVCVCVSKVFGLECYANSCIICLGLSLNKLQLQN